MAAAAAGQARLNGPAPVTLVGQKRRRQYTAQANPLASPVKTPEERALFFKLLEEHNPAGKDSGWSSMTVAWNTHLSDLLNASGDHNSKSLGIFPKMSVQLRGFYKEHVKQVQVQQSLNYSPATREEHAAMNRSLNERFWGREVSFSATPPGPPTYAPDPTPSPYPPPFPESSAFTYSLQQPHETMVGQSSYLVNQERVGQGSGPQYAPIRGGKGKGKICKTCKQPTLGHPKKSCPVE